MAFVLGLDVGYSNLKIVSGPSKTRPAATILPAGAGPLSTMPDAMTARRAASHLTVTVDGEPWAAGVEPGRLQQWERDLHPDYPATTSFRALFFAALLTAGVDTIDRLVTGLPVSQAQNNAKRTALRNRLAGVHQVTPKRSVTVAKVTVLPQPVGAYLDYLENAVDPKTVERERILVLDPGFFSVDWVVIEGGEIFSAISGTSTAAMSAVIEAADLAIAHDHGGAVGREQIEAALRNGVESVMLFGQTVMISPYIEQAARRYSATALTALRQSMRGEKRDIDAVLLAGGGADAYRQAAAEAFPKAQILRFEKPVLANARGFWSFAA